GLDLVREQIRVADGQGLSRTQEQVTLSGHAIECRINAEDPDNFMPSPGKVKNYHAPGGFGVRVDSGLYSGYAIPPYYDSMIGKLIVHGETRQEAINRLSRSLEEFIIDGIKTTIPLQRSLLAKEEFVDGDYTIKSLEAWLEEKSLKKI
ncbi:MAG: acetyl-CoA carboxylase biotin carboxylase subunit, partial [Zymomonas sp.]|nr:acetyl-CoA carboxylase biotin carboxylase subunit [Zymomonas sp.]